MTVPFAEWLLLVAYHLSFFGVRPVLGKQQSRGLSPRKRGWNSSSYPLFSPE
jgi:hypothetical protein